MFDGLINAAARVLLAVVPFLVFIPSILGADDYADDDRKNLSSFEIEVQSPTGFSPNPDFKVTIFGSGRVEYVGNQNVHWRGKRHDRIQQDAFLILVSHVRQSK